MDKKETKKRIEAQKEYLKFIKYDLERLIDRKERLENEIEELKKECETDGRKK